MGSRALKDAWDRWSAAWHLLFVALCALALALVVFDPDNHSDPLPPILLTGLLIAWYAASLRLPTLSAFGYAGYFALGWTIWYGLAGYNLAFMLVLGGLFPQVFVLAGLPAAIGFALILNGLVLLQLQRINSSLTVTWTLIMAVMWVGGALLAYYITDIIRQSRERQVLIEQLTAAQTRIAEMERQAGIAHERQRLAGELHDTIAQGLIGIVTHLEAADAAPADSRRYLDGAKQLARESLNEVRHFIWELRPPVLEGRLFEEGLREVAASWSSIHGIPVDVVITGTPRGLVNEVTLLRITQEALANVSKHAHARRVTITLSYMPDRIMLDINDDGVGFAPEANGSGYGLINMRGRVAVLGGTLTVESAANAGTTLVVEIPLSE